MKIIFEERSSDSPFIERVWRSHSEEHGLFTSIARSHLMLVVEKLSGNLKLYLHGPETRPTTAYCPVDGEWIGILFKFGTFMPLFPIITLLDRGIALPEATGQHFWLDSAVWEIPTYENVETFVDRLVHQQVLLREPMIETVLHGQAHPVSSRSAQRYFIRATGLTHSDARLIERARYATSLLRQGRSILDTVYEAGYFDQPHLTRSLKRFIGHTPAQIIDQQLSFLYNTAHPLLNYDALYTTPIQEQAHAQNRISDDDHAQRSFRHA
jgi:AraC-like DNA-binding protein